MRCGPKKIVGWGILLRPKMAFSISRTTAKLTDYSLLQLTAPKRAKTMQPF
jgi:hypothetical protein